MINNIENKLYIDTTFNHENKHATNDEESSIYPSSSIYCLLFIIQIDTNSLEELSIFKTKVELILKSFSFLYNFNFEEMPICISNN